MELFSRVISGVQSEIVNIQMDIFIRYSLGRPLELSLEFRRRY